MVVRLCAALLLCSAGCTAPQLIAVPSELDVAWQQAVTARLNALVACQSVQTQQCIDAKEAEYAGTH